MKKAIIGLFILISLNAKSQTIKDTTVQLNFSKEDWGEIIQHINASIDSKIATEKLYKLLDKGFKIIVLDKPKEVATKPKQ